MQLPDLDMSMSLTERARMAFLDRVEQETRRDEEEWGELEFIAAQTVSEILEIDIRAARSVEYRRQKTNSAGNVTKGVDFVIDNLTFSIVLKRTKIMSNPNKQFPDDNDIYDEIPVLRFLKGSMWVEINSLADLGQHLP